MKRPLICTHLTLAFVVGITLSAAAPPQAVAVKPESHTPTVAEAHARTIELMKLSIEKQKAAVRLQVGEDGPSASFFTTPWVTTQTLTAESMAPPPLLPSCDPMEESELAPLVKDAALAQDISPRLLRAVIRRESASSPCAISAKGAIGLMQLMPETAQQLGADPYDAKQNVEAGSRYLKQLLTKYKGDTKLALAAYNAGPGRVDEAGGVPPIPETTAYVAAILKDMESASVDVNTAPKPEE